MEPLVTTINDRQHLTFKGFVLKKKITSPVAKKNKMTCDVEILFLYI